MHERWVKLCVLFLGSTDKVFVWFKHIVASCTVYKAFFGNCQITALAFFRIILNKAKSENGAKRTHMRAYVHTRTVREGRETFRSTYYHSLL